MKSTFSLVLGWAACWAALVSAVGSEPPRTGPETEKRFPPLKVPPGLKATLFACDPLVAYPSAVALGPRPGSILVALDYLSGLGGEIVRRDEIRLIEDIDGDGYGDRATVYASGLNSIQGLTYQDGTVFVMHAPLLSALRDEDGDGLAEQRRDLLTGLGLPPERNPERLHCANGVVAGHDGWLYLALGDHGCEVPRPEGDRLMLRGGGILRCRADGRDLHVFTTGLRNIYDVALDEELNVFVRDNENDGGDYKVRLYHSFWGADHGYPYLYAERPAEALPPLADLGLGSSAGGLCYLETGLPPEFRGNLFFCEWGRAVMRCRPERAGSSFAPLKEIEFASGDATDPYGFKPTDLVVERDGCLIVADWADGQRPKRGRGRIYRIAPVEGAGAPRRSGSAGAGAAGWIARLDSESYYERVEAQAALERLKLDGVAAVRQAIGGRHLGVRGRQHAIWALARAGGPAKVGELLDLARAATDPCTQAQAIRAVADLADPVLVRHRLDAGPGDADLAQRLADLAQERDPRVVREVVIAVGRLGWPAAPAWLRSILKSPDAALAHAAVQTMRRSANWPAILALLDEADSVPVRAVALRAIAGRALPSVVDGLIQRLQVVREPARRRAYADLLSRVFKKPGPAPYWGYRPPPRPPNTVSWERTDAIAQALDRLLVDPDREVRLAVLGYMRREGVPTRPATLGLWLREEHSPNRVAAILPDWDRRPGLPLAQQPEPNRALAELQGATGALIGWQVAGPMPVAAAAPLIGQVAPPGQAPKPLAGLAHEWRPQLASHAESPLRLGSGRGSKGTVAWLAITELDVPEVTAGQFLVSGDGGLRIWLNGHLIHEREAARPLAPAPGQLDTMLVKGTNRVLVEVVASAETAEFRVRFRRKSSSNDHERLMQAALTSSGDAVRGRKLFLDTEKSQCLTCHRIGDHGERIGPELTGVGGRLSRIFIVESILEPSRSIAPSFETVVVALKDGRVLAGVRAAETELTLTLADQQGRRHVLAKSSIAEQRPQSQSTMPEGLEKRLTRAEFIDFIEFLTRQR